MPLPFQKEHHQGVGGALSLYLTLSVLFPIPSCCLDLDLVQQRLLGNPLVLVGNIEFWSEVAEGGAKYSGGIDGNKRKCHSNSYSCSHYDRAGARPRALSLAPAPVEKNVPSLKEAVEYNLGKLRGNQCRRRQDLYTPPSP